MEINGIEYVDLDLPSGTLWAKCNLGAEHEWENGKYYQWGATEGYYPGQGAEEHSSWETAPFNFGDTSCHSSIRKTLIKRVAPQGTLHKKYDAVYQATGGKAHIPTKEQFQELFENTQCKKISYLGHEVISFASPIDSQKVIVFPMSGYAINNHYTPCATIYLWSSSLDITRHNKSYSPQFTAGFHRIELDFSFYGQPIRPVTTKSN